MFKRKKPIKVTMKINVGNIDSGTVGEYIDKIIDSIRKKHPDSIIEIEVFNKDW